VLCVKETFGSSTYTLQGEQVTVGITKLPLMVPWLSAQLAVGPGLVVLAPPLVPQA
jgi:hypothetical protein